MHTFCHNNVLPCYFSTSQSVRLNLLHIKNLNILEYFWPLVVRPNFIKTGCSLNSCIFEIESEISWHIKFLKNLSNTRSLASSLKSQLETLTDGHLAP